MICVGKFTGVLLASDFDDTLVGESCVLSPANRAALEHFTAEGGVFTVSTGRAKRTFAPYAHTVPINAPVVLSNGAMLYDFSADRVVVDLPLPATAAADLTALSGEMPELGIECYHGDDVYIHRPNAHTQRHVERVKTTWTERALLDMPTPWSKAVIQADHQVLLKAQAVIRQRWGDRYEAIFSNAVLLECTAKTASKGGMVLKLAQLLGIDRANIYCAGDNQNDIPMLAASAIPFAPGNCAQAVKDWGATVLRPCEEDFIAQVVGILELRYGG